MGRPNPGMFSSHNDDWETPPDLFRALDAEFGFTLDPCATERTAKCERFFTPDDDGLTQSWGGVVFMNPPYGRGIAAWMDKALAESQRGATVVALVPARTETAWWHRTAMRASEVRLIRGRLNFGGFAEKGHNAPFPSAIVVFRPGDHEPELRAWEAVPNG